MHWQFWSRLRTALHPWLWYQGLSMSLVLPRQDPHTSHFMVNYFFVFSVVLRGFYIYISLTVAQIQHLAWSTLSANTLSAHHDLRQSVQIYTSTLHQVGAWYRAPKETTQQSSETSLETISHAHNIIQKKSTATKRHFLSPHQTCDSSNSIKAQVTGCTKWS